MTHLTGGISLSTTAKCKNRERESIVFPALYTSASILYTNVTCDSLQCGSHKKTRWNFIEDKILEWLKVGVSLQASVRTSLRIRKLKSHKFEHENVKCQKHHLVFLPR